ncbi:Fic family protein [Candidatus Woesearchaeota archaeon]|nr:Fic family protein [Candidatus Woesearchaeota archaeon]
MKTLTKEHVIDINQKLGKEFKTEYGLSTNRSNLDYAISLENNPYKMAKEILRGHPFIDANKRTTFMVYMLLTTDKSFEEILKDFYNLFQNLAK